MECYVVFLTVCNYYIFMKVFGSGFSSLEDIRHPFDKGSRRLPTGLALYCHKYSTPAGLALYKLASPRSLPVLSGLPREANNLPPAYVFTLSKHPPH